MNIGEIRIKNKYIDNTKQHTGVNIGENSHM